MMLVAASLSVITADGGAAPRASGRATWMDAMALPLLLSRLNAVGGEH